MSSAAALKAWATRRARAAGHAPAVPARRVVGASNAAAHKAVATRREWKRLEEEYAALWQNAPWFGLDVGVPYSNRPHPDSYGAHLPMCSTPATVAKSAPIRTTIHATKPHPASYGAALPMRGLGLKDENPIRVWTLTAAEKKTLAARPLTTRGAQ